MRIERIALENFLAFDATAVRLAPGLNVVLSPNEGGKSSLFRGIVAALFVGVSSRAGEIRALGRWGSGSLFKVELELELGGSMLRLVRDFRTREQAIYREGEKSPVAVGKAVDEFLGEHLSLANEDLFLRVCGVRHEELSHVSDGAAIGEKIEEILGGGWGEMTPARLKQTVETKRRELLKGRDRPVFDENIGAVRRFMNGVDRAEGDLARARDSMKRREELLRCISGLHSSIERANGDAEILRSKRDKATQYGEIEKKEQEARGKAESLRKRIDRLKALASKKEELLREGAKFPGPLASMGAAAMEELRRDIEVETLISSEIGGARGGIEEARTAAAGSAFFARLVIALALILAGVLGGMFWKWPLFLMLAPGIGIALWCLRGSRGAGAGAVPQEKVRELERLAEKRSVWASGRDVTGSRNLLQDYARWSGELRDVDVRLEELEAGRRTEHGDLLLRLDEEYGNTALEARALGEERSKLEPFKADAGERLKIEREIRLKEREQTEAAEALAGKERELAALERLDANEASERLETAKENLKRVERKVAVADLILDALEEARRETSGFLAEQLPRHAAEYLSRITDGRYRTLFVDPLTMRIETVPASGDAVAGGAASPAPERVGPELLSQGARDQIHLAVRLGLLRLLSRGEAQPLFLDDPFVHFDAERRERALELIRDFSRTNQVVIFTCDPYYRGVAQHLVEIER